MMSGCPVMEHSLEKSAEAARDFGIQAGVSYACRTESGPELQKIWAVWLVCDARLTAYWGRP
jgi:hypothetical protein